MDALHKIVSPGLFYAVAGVNIVAGAALIRQPLPLDELRAKFAAKFGGDVSKTAADLRVLKGSSVQLQGKGVLLAAVGGLLAYALHTKDKKFINAVVAAIAAGDVALLALWAKAKQDDASFPQLTSEQALAKFGLGYAAAEALALGSYLWSCTKH